MTLTSILKTFNLFQNNEFSYFVTNAKDESATLQVLGDELAKLQVLDDESAKDESAKIQVLNDE